MIQSFSLTATPALARRLLEFSALCKLALDPAILALAEMDRLTDESLSPSHRHAMQFLLDCEFRTGLIRSEIIDRTLILEAISRSTLAAEHPVIIACGPVNRQLWYTALEQAGSIGHEVILRSQSQIEAALADRACSWRHGVLIQEWRFFDRGPLGHWLALEFPRTILLRDDSLPYQSHRAWARLHDVRVESTQHWWPMARCLYPTLPQEPFTLPTAEFQQTILSPKTWKILNRNALAGFYNVFLPQNFSDSAA